MRKVSLYLLETRQITLFQSMFLRTQSLAIFGAMGCFRLVHSLAQTGYPPRTQPFRSLVSSISSSTQNDKRIFSASALKAIARDSLAETSTSGEFQRRESAWRNFIEKDGEFPPEAGRYHLYVAYAW